MRSHKGLTILELMVGLAIIGLLTAIFLGFYKKGFSREYELSTTARSLAAALNMTRMRAMESGLAVKLTGCTGTVSQNTWTFTFTGTSSVPSGFTTTPGGNSASIPSDPVFVTFSNLDPLNIRELNGGMNGGAFMISNVTETVSSDQTTYTVTFTCSFYVQPSSVGPQPPYTYGSGTRPPAFARNLRRSAQLIILKKSAVNWSDSSTVAARQKYDSGNYFFYNDYYDPGTGVSDLVITQQIDTTPPRRGWTPSATLTGTDVCGYFDSLGVPSPPQGYLFLLTLNVVGSSPRVRTVTVTPSGRVVVGTVSSTTN